MTRSRRNVHWQRPPRRRPTSRHEISAPSQTDAPAGVCMRKISIVVTVFLALVASRALPAWSQEQPVVPGPASPAATPDYSNMPAVEDTPAQREALEKLKAKAEERTVATARLTTRPLRRPTTSTTDRRTLSLPATFIRRARDFSSRVHFLRLNTAEPATRKPTANGARPCTQTHSGLRSIGPV
jgi:hypothetical protein